MNTEFRGVLPLYDIFGGASDFAHNFKHLMPNTLNCGATCVTPKVKKSYKDFIYKTYTPQLRKLFPCVSPIFSNSIKESEFFPEVIFKQVLIQSDPQSGKIWHIDMTFLN